MNKKQDPVAKTQEHEKGRRDKAALDYQNEIVLTPRLLWS